MGHLVTQKPYLALQERLHKNPVGAPPSEELFEILRLRFTEEEAEIGARMPMTPAPIEQLSRRLGQEPERLRAALDRMAEKGLVLDFLTNGRPFYMLAPTVIGFFEFTFMRTRPSGVAPVRSTTSSPGCTSHVRIMSGSARPAA